ncbi:MAG: flagellar export protein FliJ [Aquabacterium sp.]|nr:flagellar export protein FliJ [Aquabacterium sp.]
MQSLATLQTLLQQAEAERDAAQALLAQLERARAQAEAQAEQLTQYREQYQQRWSAQFRRSGAIELLQCYQGFSGRLDQACSMQGQAADQALVRVDQARAELIAREQRVAAVRKLIERRQTEQHRRAERREQVASDEAAARSFSASRPSALLI